MQRSHTQRSDMYWAMLPTDEIVPCLDGMVEDYMQFLMKSNKLSLWRAQWNQYYKAESRVGLVMGGDRAQYKILGVNHYASLLQGLVSIICQQNPAFEPISINSDVKSMSQDLVAKSVLDYYMREQRLAHVYKTGVEIGEIFGEAELYHRWNSLKGQVVEVDENGNPINEGDLEVTILNPMDVVRDYTRTDTNNDWYILREYVNKWDLIAQRPDLEDQIKGEGISANLQRFRFGHLLDESSSMDDLVPKYTFVHKRTPALPEGRLVEYVGDTAILDSALPYDDMPVLRFTPSDILQNNFGTTVATKLLPLQQAYDILSSTIITNASHWGLGNIQIPMGGNIKIEQLVDGLNAIRTPMGTEVKPVIMPSTPREIFEYLGMLELQMEKISGINATLRGQPPANLQSGTALAFVQAQSLVFNSSSQLAYNKMVEDSGTLIINILKTFAKSKRMITISGKSKKSYMKAYSSEDLSNISRVVVNVGNPLTKTMAGRIQIGQDLLQNKLVTTPQQYLMVLETGSLDPLVEGETAQLMNIRQENERLAEGEPCQVVATDNPALHIPEHAVVLASPEARENPTVVTNTLAHIQEHINVWRTADPALLQLLGIPPFPQVQAQAMSMPGVPTDAGTAPMDAAVGNPNNPMEQALEAPTPPRGPGLPPGTDAMTQQASANLNA